MPDFDEGKRSCRRKLEQHNKRRRRRSTNPSSNVEKEKELQGDLLADGNCDAQTKGTITLICMWMLLFFD